MIFKRFPCICTRPRYRCSVLTAARMHWFPRRAARQPKKPTIKTVKPRPTRLYAIKSIVSWGLTSGRKRFRRCPLLGSNSNHAPITSTVQPANCREYIYFYPASSRSELSEAWTIIAFQGGREVERFFHIFFNFLFSLSFFFSRSRAWPMYACIHLHSDYISNIFMLSCSLIQIKC